VNPHSGLITDMQFNEDRTLLVTSSKDHRTCVLHAWSLETLKSVKLNCPANAGAIRPGSEHLINGGGQDAMNVTTTSTKSGKFEARFWDYIYEEEFGRVKGHFGPINSLAISPDGLGYCSGAEDGYIRLHHFDQDYLDRKDPVPEGPPGGAPKEEQ
jgi:translation initiation factor 3 subunit I